LVKPQFEVGKGKVGKSGVVRDQAQIQEVVEKIKNLGPNLNPPLKAGGQAFSRVLGPKGNREVFVLLESN
jgi:23S rRNA (cytidine1920-2'-O)/16S rRNA (cytidine1409-2'-O)-methyltransferase